MDGLPAHTHPESAHAGQWSPQLQEDKQRRMAYSGLPSPRFTCQQCLSERSLWTGFEFPLACPQRFRQWTYKSFSDREDFPPSYSTGSFLETKAIRTVNMESIFHVLNSLHWYSLHFMDAAIEAQRS